MHGVPANLPLQRLVGQSLDEITLTRFQANLHFATGSISMLGRWELRDSEKRVLDASEENDKRDSYQLHRLLERTVEGVEIDAPRSFTLVFGAGYRLTVFDDSDQYESFSLHLDGMADIHV